MHAVRFWEYLECCKRSELKDIIYAEARKKSEKKKTFFSWRNFTLKKSPRDFPKISEIFFRSEISPRKKNIFGSDFFSSLRMDKDFEFRPFAALQILPKTNGTHIYLLTPPPSPWYFNNHVHVIHLISLKH